MNTKNLSATARYVLPSTRFTQYLAFPLLLTACLTSSGCAPEADPDLAHSPPVSIETVQQQATRLAQEMIIIDTHVDVPYRLEEEMEDISVRTETGDFDFERARIGGLDAPFLSIYVPADYQETGGAKEFADSLIDMVEGITRDHPDKFAIATSIADIRAAKEVGRVAFPMGMENGAPIEDDLNNVQHFFDRGIRYITLTHSKNNQICDSSYEVEHREWGGLSPFGKEVVAEMNRVGIMVDISHVSDDTFYQVIETTEAPVIASHSSVRHFTPGFERNMDDAMIRALAENKGVVQINFGSAFLTQAANEQVLARFAHLEEYAKTHELDPESEEFKNYTEQYRAENPTIYATLDDVVAHIDHVVQLVGVDFVGLGSDFDGVGDSLPTGLKDVSEYPNLIAALLERGYSEEDISKILSGNITRVWTRVEEVAQELQAASAS